VNKIAASAAQLAKCILFNAFFTYIQLLFPAVREQTKTSCSLFNKMA